MTGSVALVTGANKGIGLATARLLAARGVRVLVGARDAERGRRAVEELRAGGADAHLVPLDVTDDASVRRAAELVGSAHGRLDILVNNAGIAGSDAGPPSRTRPAELRAVFETNVVGAVATTNALLPLLRQAPAGRIVNVSSDFGSVGAMTDRASLLWSFAALPYPVSKTALNMVTAMYAKELDGTAVKVNAANPGYCATDLNRHQGWLTAEQGAAVPVHLATLPADGPNGVLWGYVLRGGRPTLDVLPW